MEPTNANTTVAEEIAVLMARRGRMTNAALAEATGIEKSTLGRKLRGLADFRVSELESIASFFDVPITDLFGHRAKGGRLDNVGEPPVDNQLALFAAAA